MRILMSAVLAACLAAPVPALAVAGDDNGDNKVVCRSNRDHNVGTRIRAPRVCRTRAEWREEQERTQSEMQQIRDGQAPSEGSSGAEVSGGPSA
jgi:hypothetical protein